MKYTAFIAAALLIAAPAFAHTPPANPNPDTPAVTTTDSSEPVQPAKGANSFTEAQAKSRIEAKGFCLG